MQENGGGESKGRSWSFEWLAKEMQSFDWGVKGVIFKRLVEVLVDLVLLYGVDM